MRAADAPQSPTPTPKPIPNAADHETDLSAEIDKNTHQLFIRTERQNILTK